jgi:hypothetical protein
VSSRPTGPSRPTLGGLGLGGPVPRDLLALLAVLFVTFSLQFLAPALVRPLRLTSEAWRGLQVWRIATYPVAGFGPPSLWFLLELLMVFWFGRDAYHQLGRRRFWRLLAGASAAAGATAAAMDVVRSLATAHDGTYVFHLMQGQRVVLAILVAVFAIVNRDATVYLFFVLPIVARWFLWLELLIAFISFLPMPEPGTPRDLPGLCGIFVAVGLTWLALKRRRRRGGGLREGRLQLERWWLERRLARHRRKSGLRVVRGDDGGGVRKGPWVH